MDTSSVLSPLSDAIRNHIINVENLKGTKEIAKAALGLVILNGGVAIIYKGTSYIWEKITSKSIVSVELNNKDESFSWIIEWLSQQPASLSATKLALASTYDSEHGNNSMNNRPKILLTPSVGSHLMTYRGKWFWLSRSRYTNAIDFASGLFLETIKITTLGKDRKPIERLIQDALDISFSKEEGKTVIWSGSGGSWRKFGSPRAPRPLESVLLDNGIKENVLLDIQEFLGNANWYRDMGIPYRRGYLLHGYPGSGKTSFILALAAKFHMNICMVSLNDKDMSDDQLNHLLNSAPPRSILLLEDIDAAFLHRDAHDQMSRITFSGLLNALDGVAAQEGKLLFMTTNYVEKLDSALIRPGRVDFACFFGLATNYQARQLLERFYPTESPLVIEEMARKIPDEVVTMAELQGYLLKYKKSSKEALIHLDEFISQMSKKPYKLRELKLV